MPTPSAPPDASLHAPFELEFPFSRTTGPIVGTFLGGLKERRLLGIRTPAGQVLCPPHEFDPATGAQLADPAAMVDLEPVGAVHTWTWVRSRPGDPVEGGFAWALIQIDGASGTFFHAVDTAGDPDLLQAGTRVRARWADERVGSLRDLACFEVVDR